MASLTAATASLVVQIAVLILLIIAISLKNKRRYRQHGIIMASAVVLHLVTVVAVMGPTFSTICTTPAIVFDVTLLLTIVHGTLGIIAIVFGIWLVLSWCFKTDLKNCFAKKRLMRSTLVLWFTSALLGILMYLIFWVSQLFSLLRGFL